MSWDSFDHAAATLTLLILLHGLWKALWEVNSRAATRHLGPVLQEGKDAGYFGADIPHKLWNRWLYPFWVPPVEMPRVPTVGSIIQAGDAGLFTSGMIDGLGAAASRPTGSRYFRVSWRPIYEAFFQEYAWALESQPGVGSWHTTPGYGAADFTKYVKKAQFDVWRAKKDAEGGAQDLVTYWKETCLWPSIYALLDRLFGWCFGKEMFRAQKGASNLVISPTMDKIPHLNPHLYYYPWRWPATWPGRPLNGTAQQYQQSAQTLTRPLLVRSLRVPGNEEDALRRHDWARHQSLWMRGQEPAIEVSEEEIAALSFFLGLELHTKPNEYTPHGRGGFGLLLGSNHVRGSTTIHVAYGSKSPFGGSVGCSGYSTLFAKHLACGCIPFATSADATMHTVAVTADVYRGIRQGHAIWNRHACSWSWYKSAAYCLWRMPHTGAIDAYSESVSLQQSPLAAAGALVHGQQQRPLGFWWEAVAGIAFGGLAPLATKEVVASVRFTVGLDHSRLGAEDVRSLDRLMRFVMDGIWRMGHFGHFTLFGEACLARLQCLDDKTSTAYDYEGWVQSLPGLPMRDIIAFLSRYTTLLEAIIARVALGYGYDEDDVFKAGRERRDATWKACAGEVRSAYLRAVQRGGEDRESEARRIADLLEPVLEALHQGDELSPQHAGTVALCIIMLWTDLVRVVDWDKPNPVEGSTYYRPLTLDELPDVAAWE